MITSRIRNIPSSLKEMLTSVRKPTLYMLSSLMILACAGIVWSTDIVSVTGGGINGIVYADGTSGGTPAPAASQAPSADKAGADIINGLLQIMFMLLTPVIMLCNWLLTPDWTYGDVFLMRPVLYDLWILVSNIVYIIFALLLVIIALLNVFGKGNNYQIGTLLPKFVVGIIIVPLSWFIVSLVLSVTNLLTASVMGIPMYMINNGTLPSGVLSQINIPTNCYINLVGGQPSGGSSTPSSDTSG